MEIPPTLVVQLSPTPVSFSTIGLDSSYGSTPFVTIKQRDDYIIIRTVVFIDSDSAPLNNQSIVMLGINNGKLHFRIDSDSPNQDPTSFTAWMLDVPHVNDPDNPVDSVKVTLKNNAVYTYTTAPNKPNQAIIPLVDAIDNTKIVVRPYSLPISFTSLGIEFDSPMSPTVTTTLLENNILGIRCIAFTDDEFIEAPWITTVGKGTAPDLQKTLFLNTDYLSISVDNPKHYAWLVEVNVDLNLFPDIEEVCSYVTNKDPKTSRGTYTVVPKPDQPSPTTSDV